MCAGFHGSYAFPLIVQVINGNTLIHNFQYGVVRVEPIGSNNNKMSTRELSSLFSTDIVIVREAVDILRIPMFVDKIPSTSTT